MPRCTTCVTSPMSCTRCSVAICADHQAIEHDTCVDCAVAYYDDLDRVDLRAWFLAGFMLPWGAYLALYEHLPSWSARSGGPRAITTGLPALDVVIMVAIVAVFAGKAAMGVRKSLHRRSFVTRELARAKLVR